MEYVFITYTQKCIRACPNYQYADPSPPQKWPYLHECGAMCYNDIKINFSIFCDLYYLSYARFYSQLSIVFTLITGQKSQKKFLSQKMRAQCSDTDFLVHEFF